MMVHQKMVRHGFICCAFACLLLTCSFCVGTSSSSRSIDGESEVFLSNPENSVIRSGTVWKDTAGNEVHAHGGGFFVDQQNSKYYWFGTTQKLAPDWLSEGINCYSSDDLTTWTFERRVFDNTSIKISTPGPYRIERPKVIYNNMTKKYVMWFHLDTASFSIQSVGVVVSDTLTGKYEWVAGFQPDGIASYDMTLFQDSDGSAYLFRSAENRYVGISQLTDDYLNTKGIISKAPSLEGQAVWKMNGIYYLLGSHLTGWAANQAILCRSDSPNLKGTTWTTLPVITTNTTTYESQSTYVLPYRHPDGRMLYIFMGDRWAYPQVDKASYIWLPFVISTTSGYISLPWEAAWLVKNF